ncbi:MAG: DUF4342 domain-containing protein [Clostridiales bacterium]|nr:DUF4342 domain-containing protein [Clostridiales bacterium]
MNMHEDLIGHSETERSSDRDHERDHEKFLQQLDAICARSGVSYRQAEEALIIGGNVVGALIWLEEQEEKKPGIDPESMGKKIGEFASTVCHKAGTRLQIRHDEKAVAEIPLLAAAAGIAAVCFVPVAAAATTVGAVTAMANGVTLKVVEHEHSGQGTQIADEGNISISG